ncbi:MAG: rod shape-determining protein MreC [Myxococcota bacterium]|nr:rod shape-determining protein MreC [Myxococcota bacterium]MDW8361098.1 rod shape-determining protein MreC [Myxococcales bacterium]
MELFRRLRDAALSAALLALPFFLLRASLIDPSRTTWLDRALLTVAAPVQFVATQLALAVSEPIERYVWLVEVKKENDRLRAENARLRAALRELRGVHEENRRLRDLLAVRQAVGVETLSARVIAREVTPFFRVVRIRLDRGARDELRAGMAVIAADGLAGQIRRVWDRYADVLLSVDPTSAIDVVVRRTGARGMLRGTGASDRYLSRVEMLSREDEVRPGDEVYTSGLGQHFPPGILVGHVVRVERAPSGLFQRVEVTPAVDFSRLDEVLVILGGSREQQALPPDDLALDPDIAPPLDPAGPESGETP